MVKTNAKSRARWLAEQLEIEPQIQLADIGARIIKRDPFYSALLDFGLVQLHGFEPEPIAFEALKAAAGPNMTVYPTAVGKPGPATFYAHHIGSLSSVFKIKAAAAYFLGKSFWVQRPITEHDMTLVALDEIADFPDLDILKMDTQGAELDILQGARRTLADAVMIVPEVRFYQMYDDEPMWADVDTELRAQGFVLHKFLHQKSVVLPASRRNELRIREGTQLLDGDAVYIRNLEDDEKVSDRQLKLLAIAADTMIQSYDLCAFCLRMLSVRGVVPNNAASQYIKRLPSELLLVPKPAE